MTPYLIFLCNYFDDSTRQERGITSDSPAASRKIIMLCGALRTAGIRPFIVSLGRGKSKHSPRFYSKKLSLVESLPIYYSSFSSYIFASQLLSLISPLYLIFRLRSRPVRAIIFYNRHIAYLPALIIANCLGYRCILDLEDGEVFQPKSFLKKKFNRSIRYLFDGLCNGGALLACNALQSHTKSKPLLTYYGVVGGEEGVIKKFESEIVTVLIGGTLCVETGAQLLADAIGIIRNSEPTWAQNLRFEITGYGDSLVGLSELANHYGFPVLRVHGRLEDEEYRKILNNCDVGLALKLNNGDLADTTFPSKITEYAASGLLVVTTDISDVRDVLGSGAFYLTHDDPFMLVELLKSAVLERDRAAECALEGSRNVRTICSPCDAGKQVANFIFGNSL